MKGALLFVSLASLFFLAQAGIFEYQDVLPSSSRILERVAMWSLQDTPAGSTTPYADFDRTSPSRVSTHAHPLPHPHCFPGTLGLSCFDQAVPRGLRRGAFLCHQRDGKRGVRRPNLRRKYLKPSLLSCLSLLPPSLTHVLLQRYLCCAPGMDSPSRPCPLGQVALNPRYYNHSSPTFHYTKLSFQDSYTLSYKEVRGVLL